jgi:hypothetical protein
VTELKIEHRVARMEVKKVQVGAIQFIHFL